MIERCSALDKACAGMFRRYNTDAAIQFVYGDKVQQGLEQMDTVVRSSLCNLARQCNELNDLFLVSNLKQESLLFEYLRNACSITGTRLNMNNSDSFPSTELIHTGMVEFTRTRGQINSNAEQHLVRHPSGEGLADREGFVATAAVSLRQPIPIDTGNSAAISDDDDNDDNDDTEKMRTYPHNGLRDGTTTGGYGMSAGSGDGIASKRPTSAPATHSSAGNKGGNNRPKSAKASTNNDRKAPSSAPNHRSVQPVNGIGGDGNGDGNAACEAAISSSSDGEERGGTGASDDAGAGTGAAYEQLMHDPIPNSLDNLASGMHSNGNPKQNLPTGLSINSISKVKQADREAYYVDDDEFIQADDEELDESGQFSPDQFDHHKVNNRNNNNDVNNNDYQHTSANNNSTNNSNSERNGNNRTNGRPTSPFRRSLTPIRSHSAKEYTRQRPMSPKRKENMALQAWPHFMYESEANMGRPTQWHALPCPHCLKIFQGPSKCCNG